MKAIGVRIAVPLAGLLVLVALACDKSETIAPDGSTLTLTANPAQVVLVGGEQVGSVELLATVRNSIGVPLPGQDVRFTTSSGTLTPPPGNPIPTDDLGNAACSLTGAKVGPQITATSGKATANITLTAGTGLVASIDLSPSGSVDLASCSGTDVVFDFTAKALGPTNLPVKDFTLFFDFVTSTATQVTGTFDPTNGATDANGEVTFTLTIDSTVCAARCQADKDGNSQDCSVFIQAHDRGNLIFSNQTKINDTIN